MNSSENFGSFEGRRSSLSLVIAVITAFFHRRRGRDAQCMAIEAALAEELARFQNSDDRFLALLGNDCELDPALLNVKNRIRRLALREDDLDPF